MNPKKLLAKIAQRQDISQELIEVFAFCDDTYLRNIIVKRPDLSKELIVRLANDENWDIIKAILEHQNS